MEKVPTPQQELRLDHFEQEGLKMVQISLKSDYHCTLLCSMTMDRFIELVGKEPMFFPIGSEPTENDIEVFNIVKSLKL